MYSFAAGHHPDFISHGWNVVSRGDHPAPVNIGFRIETDERRSASAPRGVGRLPPSKRAAIPEIRLPSTSWRHETTASRMRPAPAMKMNDPPIRRIFPFSVAPPVAAGGLASLCRFASARRQNDLRTHRPQEHERPQRIAPTGKVCYALSFDSQRIT